MPESQFNQEGERIHNLPWVTLDFDDEGLQVGYFDTWVRLYTDDPQFNHIDWRNAEGRYIKMVLPQASIAKMVELGFRQTVEIVPSREVEEWYIAMDMFDVDLSELRVPREWSE